MKTKDLIAELQEADPSGELECCVENIDIFTVTTEPAYWDGRLQVLKRDPAKKPYYDLVGGKYTSKGSKVVISPMSITDLLWDDPDAEIDYSEVGNPDSAERYRKSDDATRQAGRDVELKVEMDAFHRWVKRHAEEIRPGGEDCRSAADYAYGKLGLSPKDPVKDLPPKKEKHGGILGIGAKEYEVWPSWNDRREAMWDDTLEVYWRGGWGVRKQGSTEEDV
jgi:hypothetical protein